MRLRQKIRGKFSVALMLVMFVASIATSAMADDVRRVRVPVSGTIDASELGDKNTTYTVTGGSDKGGAIYVDSTGIINGTILASFIGNSVINSDYTYGGAIDVASAGKIGSIGGSIFESNTASGLDSGQGGAIEVDGTIESITNVSFKNNRAEGTGSSGNGFGGAINMASTGEIGRISGSTFEGNTASGLDAGLGGAIDLDGTIDEIANVSFKDNRAEASGANGQAHGGAIDIESAGKIGSISGSTFEGNIASGIAYGLGGAIEIYSGCVIDEITNVTFKDNRAEASGADGEAHGGAIDTYSTGRIGSIRGSIFENNTASGTYNAYGGALDLDGTIDDITGTSFTGNCAAATGASGEAYGGAINNLADSTIGIISGVTFENNIVSGAARVCGGAIHNDGVITSITDTDFTGNYAEATGESGEAHGGAINTNRRLLIKAESKDVTFRGNYVKASDMTNANGSAIFVHVDWSTGSPVLNTLTLQANTGRKITFEDDQTIEGDLDYKFNVDIKGGGTVEFLQSSTPTFKEGSGIYDAAAVSISEGTTLAISNLTADKLTLDNGIIDFTGDGKAKAYNFTDIEIKSGGGQLKLDTDLATKQMDTLNATGTVTASAQLNITALSLVSDAKGNVTTINFTDTDDIRSATKYTGTDKIFSHAANYSVNYDNAGKFTFTKLGASETTKAVSDTASMMSFAWVQTVNNLQKRLGDLRGGQASNMAWARFQRSNDDVNVGEKQSLSGNLYQVGYDFLIGSTPVAKNYFGLSLDIFDGTQSFKIGGGDAKSTTLSAYYTKVYKSGHYFDFIFRYGRFESDTQSYDAISGIATKLDYAMNSVTLSGEYGYRANLGKSGLYLEPQVEVIYGYLSGAQARSSTNYLADIDSANHFVTRLGLAFGQRVRNFNYYLRGSYYHDFAGTAHVTYGNTPYKQDGAENWWEVSLGGGWNISRVSYFYAELTKHFKDISNSLNFNIGFRFTL